MLQGGRLEARQWGCWRPRNVLQSSGGIPPSCLRSSEFATPEGQPTSTVAQRPHNWPRAAYRTPCERAARDPGLIARAAIQQCSYCSTGQRDQAGRQPCSPPRGRGLELGKRAACCDALSFNFAPWLLQICCYKQALRLCVPPTHPRQRQRRRHTTSSAAFSALAVN